MSMLVEDIDIGQIRRENCRVFVKLRLITDAGLVANDILNLCIDARAGALGPFSPSFDINKHLSDCLSNNLPENVHLMVIVQVLTTNLSTLS